jgi:hypothetical protein
MEPQDKPGMNKELNREWSRINANKASVGRRFRNDDPPGDRAAK